LDSIGEALRKAADFITHGVEPYCSGWGGRSDELFVVLFTSGGRVKDVVQ
jgi:hypothetical protein